MHPIKVKALLNAMRAAELDFEEDYILQVNQKLLDQKAVNLLRENYQILGGAGEPIYLPQLKFDFKIDRFLFLYDSEHHFNRYRLGSFKTGIYQLFTFSWLDSYKRL